MPLRISRISPSPLIGRQPVQKKEKKKSLNPLYIWSLFLLKFYVQIANNFYVGLVYIEFSSDFNLVI
jgi:hypothetical protein